jgi:NADH:ubiquinone oxidoreductase subunit
MEDQGLAPTSGRVSIISLFTLAGRDKYGNEYFENTKDYPLNQTRWVEYSGDKTFYEVDASNVPAEWHGWLHGSTNEVPTSRTTGSTHKFEPEANAHGSSAPYKRNLGGVINSHTPNLSLYRPRGYGLGNGLSGGSEPFEELYYTQPGWPLDARNKQTRQKRVLPFSLRDTPLSIKQKEAGRSGLALEDYSKSRALLTAAGAPEAATASQEAASQPKGTFAAAVHETLTAEEESFLAEGHDETDIMTTIGHYQRIIDEYQAVPNKVRRMMKGRKDNRPAALETSPLSSPLSLFPFSYLCAVCCCWRCGGPGDFGGGDGQAEEAEKYYDEAGEAGKGV